MSARTCSSCRVQRNRQDYSSNQWRKGDGGSRCSSCVGGGSSSATKKKNDTASSLSRDTTARRNNASRASFPQYNLDHPFAQGSFRWVAKGTYTVGERVGQACVCKWFKTGSVVEAHFFETDLKTSEKAVDIISQFNSGGFVNRVVQVNLPQVWTFEFAAGSKMGGQKVLQEPFIEKYQKFNSNTGWSDNSNPWPRVMQALSHYSYHVSGGRLLLCDIQGGVYSNGVVLTDPVIMSTTRIYGPTDLGTTGISSFFAHHKCNEYCKSSWTLPRHRRAAYNPTQGTTMEIVPTRRSRPGMTMGGMGAIG
eukprot:CAMPEP_0119007432 /NCGR_PEP_ID=MMETSP1176-20130426/3007_1 /TAXON_ID=265551 /ORGANISM="Synedropsis recta cf, Strain CCMP1620" /LENGTH=306 /DNA_ID=CAMNT_0006959583 /DNA_START=65 /DNA_END=982 /DNA_ORIENTATION=+